MGRGRLLGRAFVAVAGVALVASCGDPELDAILAQLGDPCLRDSDCVGAPLAPEFPEAAAVCVFGRCHVECVTTPDCRKFGLGDEIRCVLGDKPSNVCQLDDELGCLDTTKTPAVLSSARCPGDEWCGPDGECRDPCSASSDCVSGQVCVQSSCADPEELTGGLLTPVTSAGPGTPCSYSSECLGALVCRDHLCAEECKDTKDCIAPATCNVETTPENGMVHVCVSPTGGVTPAHCKNGVKDEDESAVDCGGNACLGCVTGAACVDGDDCVDANCVGMKCAAPTCADTKRNGAELDVDCGGPVCPPCADGQTCAGPGDCQGGLVCVAQVCVAESCTDAAQTGGETAVDCGGPDCDGCDPGKPCVIGGDCKQSVCAQGVCATPTCADGLKNGMETAADCGGAPASTCGPCAVGKACVADGDCASGACDGVTLKCTAPSCSDGALNGLETGIDCGGPICGSTCPNGETCVVDADCASGSGCSVAGVCAALVALHVDTHGGNGAGHVSSSDGQIACGPQCDGSYFLNGAVTLTATPSGASTFTGWSGGGCSGMGTCTPSLVTSPTNVTATFTSPVTAFQLSNGGQAAFESAMFDAQSNVFVGGWVGNGGTFGPHVIVNINGEPDAFIAKIDPGGSFVWARNFANPTNANAHVAHRVLPLPGGDVVAVVRSDGDIYYGASVTSCAATQAMSLVRLTGAAGNVVWTACYGSDITIRDALLDATGKIVVVGEFTGTVNLGGGAPLVASGSDVFIARYDPANGAFVGAKRLGDGGFDRVETIAKIPGGFLVSGDCIGSVTFDALPPTNNVVGAGSRDLCTIRLDDAFTAQWVMQKGGPGADYGGAAALLPDGTIAVGASFSGNSVDFGDGVFRDAGGFPDVLLLRLNATTGQLSTTTPNVVTYPATGFGATIVSGVEVDSNGRIHVAGFAEDHGAPSAFDFAGTVKSTMFLLTTPTSNFGAVAALHGGDGGIQSFVFRSIGELVVDPQGAVLMATRTQNVGVDPWGLGSIVGDHTVVRFTP